MAFDDFEVVSLGNVPDSALWSAVVAALKTAPKPMIDSPRPAVFLSHAIADEPRLVAVVNALRHEFGVQVFSCSDSIRSGSDWQSTIHRHLDESDVFVFVGDSPLIRTPSIARLYEAHRTHGAACSFLTAQFGAHYPYARVLRSPDGAVQAVIEERDCTPEQANVREYLTSHFLFDAQALWAVL